MVEPLLIQAVAAGCSATVESILDSDPLSMDMRRARDAALHVAACTGHRKITSMLLQQGADKDTVSSEGTTPLITAANHGRLDAVKTLLAVGADLNKGSTQDGCTALHVAVLHGYDTVVSTLLERGVDKDLMDDHGECPLSLAAGKGHRVIFQGLLAAGARTDQRTTHGGATPLHYAAAFGHAEILLALLEKGADKDALDIHGDTPLIRATYNGHLAVVEALLAAGADANVRSNLDRCSALHIAVDKADYGILSALLQRGVSTGTRDCHGQSPLISAAGIGRVCVVEALIAAGADVNLRGKENASPLHFAAIYGSCGFFWQRGRTRTP